MFNEAPYSIVPEKSGSPVFCFCDHATNHVPSVYENLGLIDADLNRHIGWDIGAEALTRQFCATFGSAGLLAGFSRLLIDPNRDLDSEMLISETSDGTPIPGNLNLSPEDRQIRIDHFYAPYHQALETQLDRAQERYVDPLIISIHSFTPKPDQGVQRELDIGLLWKVDAEKAVRLKAEIERIHPYVIGLNKPYSALKLNHTMDRHVIPRGLRHITLEIRQDLIDTAAKSQIMAQHLSQALDHFIRD
ncbi:MAG: N-formylglutamate amidohydrolase [Robiginitomaculum sp.]|nr:MAG: N-formylglutamate amidohydrolase [Robiginitomaculum sp.]